MTDQNIGKRAFVKAVLIGCLLAVALMCAGVPWAMGAEESMFERVELEPVYHGLRGGLTYVRVGDAPLETTRVTSEKSEDIPTLSWVSRDIFQAIFGETSEQWFEINERGPEGNQPAVFDASYSVSVDTSTLPDWLRGSTVDIVDGKIRCTVNVATPAEDPDFWVGHISFWLKKGAETLLNPTIAVYTYKKGIEPGFDRLVVDTPAPDCVIADQPVVFYVKTEPSRDLRALCQGNANYSVSAGADWSEESTAVCEIDNTDRTRIKCTAAFTDTSGYAPVHVQLLYDGQVAAQASFMPKTVLPADTMPVTSIWPKTSEVTAVGNQCFALEELFEYEGSKDDIQLTTNSDTLSIDRDKVIVPLEFDVDGATITASSYLNPFVAASVKIKSEQEITGLVSSSWAVLQASAGGAGYQIFDIRNAGNCTAADLQGYTASISLWPELDHHLTFTSTIEGNQVVVILQASAEAEITDNGGVSSYSLILKNTATGVSYLFPGQFRVVAADDLQSGLTSAITSKYGNANSPFVLYGHKEATMGELFGINPSDARDVMFSLQNLDANVIQEVISKDTQLQPRTISQGTVTAKSLTNPSVTATAHVKILSNSEDAPITAVSLTGATEDEYQSRWFLEVDSQANIAAQPLEGYDLSDVSYFVSKVGADGVRERQAPHQGPLQFKNAANPSQVTAVEPGCVIVGASLDGKERESDHLIYVVPRTTPIVGTQNYTAWLNQEVRLTDIFPELDEDVLPALSISLSDRSVAYGQSGLNAITFYRAGQTTLSLHSVFGNQLIASARITVAPNPDYVYCWFSDGDREEYARYESTFETTFAVETTDGDAVVPLYLEESEGYRVEVLSAPTTSPLSGVGRIEDGKVKVRITVGQLKAQQVLWNASYSVSLYKNNTFLNETRGNVVLCQDTVPMFTSLTLEPDAYKDLRYPTVGVPFTFYMEANEPLTDANWAYYTNGTSYNSEAARDVEDEYKIVTCVVDPQNPKRLKVTATYKTAEYPIQGAVGDREVYVAITDPTLGAYLYCRFIPKRVLVQGNVVTGIAAKAGPFELHPDQVLSISDLFTIQGPSSDVWLGDYLYETCNNELVSVNFRWRQVEYQKAGDETLTLTSRANPDISASVTIKCMAENQLVFDIPMLKLGYGQAATAIVRAYRMVDGVRTSVNLDTENYSVVHLAMDGEDFHVGNITISGNEIKVPITAVGKDELGQARNDAQMKVTGTGEAYSFYIPIWIGADENRWSVANLTISDIASRVYTGDPIEPTLVVWNMVQWEKAEAGVDYTVEYDQNINAGTATVILNGIGQYKGTLIKTFRITVKSFDVGCAVASIPQKAYTGAPIEPDLVVTDGVRTLIKGVDYDVSYGNNTNIGTATVEVVGKRNYQGTLNGQFVIRPGAQSMVEDSLTAEAPSALGKPDGSIVGLTTAMEWRKSPEVQYTAFEGTDGRLSGRSGGLYEVRLVAVEGKFEASAPVQVVVPEGPALSVTFDPNYDGGESVVRTGLAHGEVVTKPVMHRVGYADLGDGDWYLDSGCTESWTGSAADNDIVVFAKWTANEVGYTVEHWQETIEGGYVLEDSEAVVTGNTGEMTNAQPEDYTGFDAQPPIQVPIAADGSTVVKVNYQRKQYRLIFRADKGDNTYDTLFDAQVKFGAPIYAPSVHVEGRLFTHWNATIPTTMPALDTTFTASTLPANTKFRVEHYLQNVGGGTGDGDFTKFETNELFGATDSTDVQLAEAAAKNYDGFVYKVGGNPIKPPTLVDGTLRLYYKRLQYKLKVNVVAPVQMRGRTDTNETITAGTEADVYYGETVDLEANYAGLVDSAGYKWLGWQSKDQNVLVDGSKGKYVFKMPAGNVELTARAERKSFQLTFDAAGGNGGATLMVPYEELIAKVAPTVEKMGYEFDEWTPATTTQMPATSTILTATWKANTGTPYKVERWQEALDGSFVLAATDGEKGTTGTDVTVKDIAYPGFTPIAMAALPKIAGDGSTVVVVRYTRNKNTLTFKADESDPSPVVHQRVKYGAPIVPPSLTRAGYQMEWTGIPGDGLMPDSALTCTATWTAAANTPYTVVHSQQTVSGGSYESVATEKKTGTTGADTSAVPKNYAGFGVASIGKDTISGDGSTKVEIRYDRNVYVATFDVGGGTPTISPSEYGYGAAIVPPANPTKNGFIFVGWEPQIAEKMPAQDVSYAAQWVSTADPVASYTIKYYKQKLAPDTNGWDESSSTAYGAVDSEATVVPLRLEGFTYDSGKSMVKGVITQQNGGLVLALYYTRNSYTLTLDANGGMGSQSIEYQYGKAIPAPTGVARPGYIQLDNGGGWQPAIPTTMPSRDVTCVAQWDIGNAKWNTAYYLETDSGYFEVGNTTPEDAQTGSMVRATDKSFDGYELDAAKSAATSTGAVLADGTLKLKLYYNRLRNTLTIDAKEGTGGYTKQVPYGAPIDVSGVERLGYTLAGWNPALPENKCMPAVASSYEAQWTANADTPYYVEHYLERLEGGYGSAPNEVEKKAGVTGQPATAEYKTSYEGFVKDEAEYQTVSVGVITGGKGLVLKLYYKRIVYTLAFDTNEDGVADITEHVKYGAQITSQVLAVSRAIEENTDGKPSVTVQTPQDPGKVFNGWTVNGQQEEALPSRMLGNQFFKARWVRKGSSAVTYYVEHVLMKDGISMVNSTDTRYAEPNEDVEAVAKNIDGYQAGSIGSGKVKADGSLRLKVIYGVQTYALALSKGEGISAVSSDQSRDTAILPDILVTVTATVDAHYDFVAWTSTDPNLGDSSASYTFEMPAKAVSLTASAKPKEYSITYQLNGGDITGVATAKYTYNQPTSLPTPTRSQYEFVGWALPNGTVITRIGEGTSGNLVLTAKWSKRVVVTFDAGGGTIGGDPKAERFGSEGDAITAPTPDARSGYTFDGWTNFTGRIPASDTTYLAKWITNGSTGGNTGGDTGGGTGGGTDGGTGGDTGGDTGGGTGGDTGGSAVTGVTLDSDTMNLTNGGSGKISVIISPVNADNQKLVWTSSDNSIATVDQNGVVTTHKPGTVTITVRTEDGGFTASCIVTVSVAEEPGPIAIKLPAMIAIKAKATTKLPTIDSASVSWSVVDKTIAKLTKDKKSVIGVKAGSTVLRMKVNTIKGKAAKLEGHELEAGKVYEIRLTVRKAAQLPTSVKLDRAKLTLNTTNNTGGKLVATVKPNAAVDREVFWESKNPKVAKVDQEGNVTAVAPGTTAIYAYTANLKRAKVTVTVEGLVTGIRFVDQKGKVLTKATMKRGETRQMFVVVNESALNKTIGWSSSNTKIATVDPSGVVKALNAGKVTLTAKAKDGSGVRKTITITITKK